MKTLEQPDIRRLSMSYEDYLHYGDEGTRTEWVGGEVIVYMPPRTEHQLILAKFFSSAYLHFSPT